MSLFSIPKEILTHLLLYCIDYYTLGTMRVSLALLSSVCKDWKEILETSYFREMVKRISQIKIEAPFLMKPALYSQGYRWKEYFLISTVDEMRGEGQILYFPVIGAKYNVSDDYFSILKDGIFTLYTSPMEYRKYRAPELGEMLSVSFLETSIGTVCGAQVGSEIILLTLKHGASMDKCGECIERMRYPGASGIILYYEGALLLTGNSNLFYSFADHSLTDAGKQWFLYSRYFASRIEFIKEGEESLVKIGNSKVQKFSSFYPCTYCGVLFRLNETLYDIITGEALFHAKGLHYVYKENCQYVVEIID